MVMHRLSITGKLYDIWKTTVSSLTVLGVLIVIELHKLQKGFYTEPILNGRLALINFKIKIESRFSRVRLY